MRLLLLLSFSFLAVAGIEQAPPAFKTNDGKAVFVDFISATYELTYDNKSKEAKALTHIIFESRETGLPIFDSVATPTEVLIDGLEVEHGYTPVPGDITFVRYINKEVNPGFHTMTISTPIIHGVAFGKNAVSSGFFIKDLTDRMFLERFVVSNYEYDQYQMTFNVKVTNTRFSHNIFANGEVVEIEKNHIQITYPSFYSSSSLYFHLVPKSKFYRLGLKYRSINGNVFPITVYSKYRIRNSIFMRQTQKILRELERDYGPWPHKSLIIYGTKLKGGMEYAGATATSLVALGHELQHGYFAKGLQPANGNSGWMDEGIASWRDKGHKTYTSPNYNSFNLGAHSIYTRKTDSNSYEKGRSFFSYMNYKLKQAGKTGLKDFLRGYFEKRKFTTVTTADFISDIQEYSGLDLTEDFDRYIFGKGDNTKSKGRSPAVLPSNPYHPSYSEAEIKSIL
jgi:hypothetical protein